MSRVFDHIPDSHKDILDSKCYAHVATLRPDGRISNHPVCLLWDGKHVRFSTMRSLGSTWGRSTMIWTRRVRSA